LFPGGARRSDRAAPAGIKQEFKLCAGDAGKRWPLRAVPSVDERLLVFATDGYGCAGALTDVADAVSAWCEVYPAEREQPVVSINDAGIGVRVRIDVLRSIEQLEAFVDLGIRCRGAIGRSRA